MASLVQFWKYVKYWTPYPGSSSTIHSEPEINRRGETTPTYFIGFRSWEIHVTNTVSSAQKVPFLKWFPTVHIHWTWYSKIIRAPCRSNSVSLHLNFHVLDWHAILGYVPRLCYFCRKPTLFRYSFPYSPGLTPFYARIPCQPWNEKTIVSIQTLSWGWNGGRVSFQWEDYRICEEWILGCSPIW